MASTGAVTDCLNTCLLCMQTAITEIQSSPLQDKDSVCKAGDSFDTFAVARKEAILRTVVSEKSRLPSFKDVVGLDEAKRALQEALIDPITYPEWFAFSDLKPWRCVLLFGPPGNGKTHLAKSIAAELDSRFYVVSSSDLISTWSGQSEKMIRELFDDALGFDGVSIIFIDEVDSLCRKRCSNEEDGNRRIKTELLLQLQRLYCSGNKTVLICATNCPWDLDTAFLRRFEKKIYVGLPTLESRKMLLKKLISVSLKFCEKNIDWDFFAHSTEGFSGDDIRRLAREIAFLQFRKYKEKRLNFSRTVEVKIEQICVNANEFSDVLKQFDRSLDIDTLNRFADFK
uniref:AAA domain-containing protein n=1 Tax=Syphacia muris TaxID=451379 RepID=A0A0N5AI30_9BILA